MRVLVVGGGSGGHITPAVAVVREILRERPRTRVEFWTDRKYYKNVTKLLVDVDSMAWGEENGRSSGRQNYVRVRKIAAGKFHRYAGWSLADYFRYFSVTVKDLILGNIGGFFGFVTGFLQSFFRLWAMKPNVIFLKGGFVGLPVGMAAKLLGIPYVVHESDAVPGLANRLLMKRAAVVATGFSTERVLPLSPPPKTLESKAFRGSLSDSITHSVYKWVGVPVAAEFKPVSESHQRALKRSFGFSADKPLVVVTGGSQGALTLDEVVREILPELLKKCSVALVAGRQHYEAMVDLKKYENWEQGRLSSDFRMWEFCPVMHELMGAADLVISRAGATTIAELAALGKSVILVPFERLPGGHQVKNAERLAEMGAAKMILNAKLEQKPNMLLDEVLHLLRSPREREGLAVKLHEQAKPDAAADLAKLVLEVAK